MTYSSCIFIFHAWNNTKNAYDFHCVPCALCVYRWSAKRLSRSRLCVCAIDCVIIDNDRIDVYSVILQWRTRAQWHSQFVHTHHIYSIFAVVRSGFIIKQRQYFQYTRRSLAEEKETSTYISWNQQFANNDQIACCFFFFIYGMYVCSTFMLYSSFHMLQKHLVYTSHASHLNSYSHGSFTSLLYYFFFSTEKQW